MDGVHRYLRYTYDAAGNRTRVTHPDWVYFTSSYTALGRLTATYENGSYPLIRPTYASQGQRSYVTRGGGTAANATSSDYDPVSRPTRLSCAFHGAAPHPLSNLSIHPPRTSVQHHPYNHQHSRTTR